MQSYHLYEHRHSNKLIEEFMLLANISVAKKIRSAFPKLAFLRSHPRPKENVMSKLIDKLSALGKTEKVQFRCLFRPFSFHIGCFVSLGYEIDDSSSKTLADSLKRYEGTDSHSVAKYQVSSSLLIVRNLRALT